MPSTNSSDGGDAGRNTLFLILTRPPMRWGVPFEALVCNGILTFFAGLWLGSPLYWALGLVFHFVMRIIASKDHNFFRIGRMWLMTKANAASPSLWGGSMLSPLPTRRLRVRDRACCV